MLRFAHLAYRRRWLVLAAWIALLLGALAYMGTVGGNLTTRQELPGSESIRASDRLASDFGVTKVEPIEVVFATSTPITAHRAVIERVVQQLRDAYPHRRIDSPFAATTGASAISPDGVLAYVTVPFDDVIAAQQAVPRVNELLGTRLAGVVTVYVAGAAAIQAETARPLNDDLVRAESIAGALSLVVLVGVLGTVFAGLVPLALSLFVIPIVLALVAALSHLTDVTVYATNVVTLVGLGIAVDYSLLVVYRFREELARGGSVEQAIAETMRTATRSVIFSGVTVGIGLGTLLLIPVPFVRSFGLAGILIPIITIAAALTLLPAMLAILGPRINRLAVVPRRLIDRPDSRLWTAIARRITRRPAAFLALGVVIAAGLAAPVRDLALGATPIAAIPDVSRGVVGSKLIDSHFGDGGSTPVRVVIDRPAADLGGAAAALRRVPGVFRVVVTPSPVHRAVTLISLTGAGALGSPEANQLVADLRSRYLPAALPRHTPFLVGGGPAVFADFQEALYGDWLWISLFVLVVTYLVLFRAFRSVILPLKAVVMNVLSVAGAYGLLVLFFQDDAGGLSPFPHVAVIAVWIPLFLFAFLYGLSMDYEVFLLARMREEIDLGATNSVAVENGLARTGKLITSAALIMVIAFGGLASSRFVEMQEFGFGLAAAILLDATVIRALVVPSLMQLMGAVNWWLPERLRRLAG